MPNATALPTEIAELTLQLRRRGVEDVIDSTNLTRALYSSDASVYRVVPLAVARPRTVEELVTVLDTARSLRMPVTTRGAGTSCAGNAVGPGLVVDVARHLNTIHHVDGDSRSAVVDPGVVQASLQQAAAPYGGLETAEGRKAAGAIDTRKFRHAGPKPQSREAALVMLADGVEAARDIHG